MDPALEPYLGGLGAEFLARYEPLGMLGRGACGAVFRARQAALDRPVVVKILHQDLSEIGVLRVRFEREAALLAQLDHPRIVKVLDYGVAGANLFLVYPDDQGISLLQWLLLRGWALGRVRTPPEVVERFMGQALEGLEHVHRHGIIHRDVKPSNLLILPDEQLRLIDFGLARPVDRGATLTRTGSIVGTPQYMAPTQIQGMEADPRDDLYSLGVVAYELLTGTQPFLGRDLAQLMNLHLSYQPPLVHETVPAVARSTSILVADMLSKARDDRPETAGAALDRLDPGRTRTAELGPATPIEVPGRRPLPPPRPAPPLSPQLKGFGAGLVLALGIALGAGFLTPPGAEPEPGPPSDPGAPAGGSPPLPAGLVEQAVAELAASGPGLDRDPARWPGQLAGLRGADAFRRWVARGGRPEALAPALREPLVALDARYRTLGLPSPFHPFLRALPRGALGAGGAEGGWMALALAARDRAEAELVRLRALDAGDRGVEAIEGLGVEARAALRLYRMVAKVELVTSLRRLYSHSAAVRGELAEFVRPGWEALAELVYAGSRAIAEDPAGGETMALRLAEALDGLAPLAIGPDCHDLSWALTGGEPRGPAWALLAATWFQEAAGAQLSAGEDPAPHFERVIGLYLAALGRAEGRSTPEGRLLRAAWGATRNLARHGSEEAGPTLAAALADGLEGQAEPVRKRVLARVRVALAAEAGMEGSRERVRGIEAALLVRFPAGT